MGAVCANSVAGSVLSGEMIRMAETQGDIYVRKDVFDARMDRMEMLLEKTVIEIKSYVDKSTGETKAYVEKAVGEIKAEVQKNGNDIKALTARVDNLEQKFTTRVDALEQTLSARIGSVENMLTWCIGLFAVLIAVTAFLTPIAGIVRKVFKPLTIKDMERVAESVSEKVAERVANAVIERHLSGGK